MSNLETRVGGKFEELIEKRNFFSSDHFEYSKFIFNMKDVVSVKFVFIDNWSLLKVFKRLEALVQYVALIDQGIRIIINWVKGGEILYLTKMDGGCEIIITTV